MSSCPANSSPFRIDLLKDHVALITGGGTGICFGIAQIFGRHGAKIAIMGRRQAVLDQACQQLKKEGIQAAGFVGDVRDGKVCQTVVDSVLKHYGKLDILINGAAGNFLCSAEELSANAFQQVIGIDLLGTFNMSKAAFLPLSASKGCIINISATLHYGATIYQTHASAAKAGVDSITRSLAIEWGKHGIRINGIAPGPIADTEGMKRLGAGVGEDAISQKIPLGRFGTSHEIALAAVFLASKSASSYISGDTLVVDGASWLSRQSFVSPEMYSFISESRKSEKNEKAQSKL